MRYIDELNAVKALAYRDGIKHDDWMKWEIQSENVIKNLGFKSGDHVRRVAMRNGKFSDR